MFWRFGFQNSSAIDALLDKEDVSLEEILEDDELLQECKAHNTKLIEYIQDPTILQRLLHFVTAEDLEDKAKLKYPYVSCEVLSSDIWSISETIVSSDHLLSDFWKFLDRSSPLDSVQAAYFTKTNNTFLSKKTGEMLKFIKSIPDIVPRLMRHLDTSAIMDLLLKLISLEEYPDGQGIIEWLHSEGLIYNLIEQLDPNNEPDLHATSAEVIKAIITLSASNPEQRTIGPNALSNDLVKERTIANLVDKMLDSIAPYAISTLAAGVSIFIELIRKNNSDAIPPPDAPQPLPLAPLLHVITSRLQDFHCLLDYPRHGASRIATTMGEIKPLGQERFRIVELYAEILHASNVARVNEGGSEADDSSMQVDEPTPNEENIFSQSPGNIFKDKFIELKIVPKLLDLFFEYPWNNFLHNVVFDVLQQILGGNNDPNSGNWKLILHTFNEARLVKKILDAVENSENQMKAINDPEKQSSKDKEDVMEMNNEKEPDEINNELKDEQLIIKSPIMESNEMISEENKKNESKEWEKQYTYATNLYGEVSARARAKRGHCSRHGYMGHLTLVAEEVVKCLERNPELLKIVPDLGDDPRWDMYVNQTLPSIREQYAAPLGGVRPPNQSELTALGHSELTAGSILSNLEITDNGIIMHTADGEEDEDELDLGGATRGFSGFGKGLGGEFDDGDEEDVELGEGSLDLSGSMDSQERFAQYLSQQISGQAHDQFGSSDEEDEEDEEENENTSHSRMVMMSSGGIDEPVLRVIQRPLVNIKMNDGDDDDDEEEEEGEDEEFDEMEFISGSGDSFGDDNNNNNNPFDDTNISGETEDWPNMIQTSRIATRFSSAFEVQSGESGESEERNLNQEYSGLDKNLTPADWNAEFQSVIENKEKEADKRKNEMKNTSNKEEEPEPEEEETYMVSIEAPKEQD